MLEASSNTIFAWSFLEATQHTCAPPSPSANNIYKPIAESKVDLPFFLATTIKTSLYFLNPLSSTNPNTV